MFFPGLKSFKSEARVDIAVIFHSVQHKAVDFKAFFAC